MSELLLLFANNLLPILLVALGGVVLGKYLGVSPDGLSKTAFYVLAPALLFSLITNSEIEWSEALQMVWVVLLLMVILGTITSAATRLLGLERNLRLAVLLGVLFMNAGNLGLSLTRFAFGETALAFASIFFAIQVGLVNTVGVFIASSGTRTIRQALVSLLKLPGLYALGLALLVRITNYTLPTPLDRSVELLAQAAIPVMILVMGLQLARIHWNGFSRPLVLATGLRLLVSPLIGVGIAILLGLTGTPRQAAILEAATPTAVIAIILGTEFDLEPLFITSVVLATTLLSPLTLTPILALLGA